MLSEINQVTQHGLIFVVRLDAMKTRTVASTTIENENDKKIIHPPNSYHPEGAHMSILVIS